MFVARLIDIAPLSKEILRHTKEVLTDGRTDGLKTICLCRLLLAKA